jgi:hypothetical protein
MALLRAFSCCGAVVLAMSALLACGPNGTGTVNGPTPPSSSSTATAATSTDVASAVPPVFDVHEWGLLDVTNTSARMLAGPSSRPVPNAPVRKPVVYFHLADGSRAGDVTARVSIPASSTFMEAFPSAATPDPTTLAWAGLHLRAEPCHVVGAPTRDLPACKTQDGLCEAADIATYEAADASCVDFAGASYNHLLYRANGVPPKLPFEVTSDGSAIVVLHARASDTLGAIVYVHNDAGVALEAVVPVPPLGQSVRLAPPTDSDTTKAASELDRAMKDSGLTSEEIAAFDRAWATNLFGAGAGAARESPARRGAAAPDDYLLFAMPVSLIEGVSTLSFTPAPRAVRRFLLVRVHV